MKTWFVSFLQRIVTNTKIFIFALIIALGIFIVVKNPGLFQASVLMMEDRETLLANQWDIGYKNTNNLLDVFIAEELKDFTTLRFSVILDPQEVLVDFLHIDSQLPYQISNQTPGSFDIILTLSTGLDYGQSLFMVPFTWATPSILLSEGNVIMANGDMQWLAIWNLDKNKTSHQK